MFYDETSTVPAPGSYLLQTGNYMEVPTGHYYFEITSSIGSNTFTEKFVVELDHLCGKLPPSFMYDQMPFEDHTHELGAPMHIWEWVLYDVVEPLETADCGPIVVEFRDADSNGDLGPLIPALFNDERSTDPFQFQIKQVSDTSLVGTYLVDVCAYYVNYPNNKDCSYVPWEIEVINTLYQSVVVRPPLLLD